MLRCDLDGNWWYESLSGAPMPGWLAEALHRRRPPPRAAASTGTPPTATHIAPGCWPAWRPSRAGEVYQACVCTQFTGTVTGDPLDFFVDGVARTAPARAAYVAGDWGAVASLSPELFLRRRGDVGHVEPDQGHAAAACRSPSALRASAKDVAENIMIVDLVRNDLGRVAVTGSVTVPELLAVRPAPGRVASGVDGVGARRRRACRCPTLLDATFPPASVTGTPKRRARELLSQWEPAGAESIAAQSVWRRPSRAPN